MAGRAFTPRWALLGGNFAIGCGVMVTAGVLNDIVRSLNVSVALGGQLIGAAAVVMAFGSPILAGLLSGWDRRQLLVLALLWFAAGHLLSAMMASYATLLPLRCLCMLGAAAFTPQAASAISALTPPQERGRAITFIFLGWAVASVVGIPLAAYVGETWGWRWAFVGVALLSLAAAAGVWRALPDGIRPTALSLADWRSVFTHPVLMAIVAVTAMSSAGQFTLFSYFAPYYRQVLGASAAEISLLFLWFGALGLVGNVLLTRLIDRIGAAAAVALTLASMAVSLLAWPLALGFSSALLVTAPWALGCFASNSAQQARLALAAPTLATALISLNSSAMYLGHFAGSASGGAMISAAGFGGLSWMALAWMCAALGTSLWAARPMRDQPHV
ncbi:MAG: putative transporter [Proteobacteria bacterium]|nr:putative transporter [Pseudomonadota bacterium]